MQSSDGMTRRPRRLDSLAVPNRPVPFAASLYNPSRRTQSLAALPGGSRAGDLSQGSFMSSLQSSSSVLPPSESMPILYSPERKPRPTRLLPELYKRPYHTIYGGLDYQHGLGGAGGLRPKVESRFMKFSFAVDAEAEERNRQRKMQNITRLMRESARLFIKADSNGDGQLDFREFYDLVGLQAKLQRRTEILNGRAKGAVGELPPMPSREMLRDYFHLIDFNHSGTLSMTEFFAFSLREGLSRGRGSIDSFLSVWDQDENNALDNEEFKRVTHALGYSSITEDLTEACEKTEDGKVMITELTRVLRMKNDGEDDKFFDQAAKVAERPIESLWARLGKKKKAINDKSGKRVLNMRRATNLRGEMPKMDSGTAFAIVSALLKVDLSVRNSPFYDPSDPETREKEDVTKAISLLRSWLRRTGLTALDLFQTWDLNGSFTISDKELGEGLALYGLALEIELVQLVFDHMTDNHKLDYDDFKEWFDSTSLSNDLSEEERIHQAATYIQKIFRARRERQKRSGSRS